MKKYSKDIFNSCIHYLDSKGYHYIPDEENGFVSFKSLFEGANDEFDCSLDIEEKNFVLSAKLPVLFDESKTDAISSYILLINANPLFAHFTIDYETKAIYCVYSAFCDGEEVKLDIVEDAIDSVVVCIKAFYTGFVDIIENDASSKEAYEKKYE